MIIFNHFGPDPYYPYDPDKQDKLDQAIILGFIKISPNQNGLVKYTLTEKGLEQWKKEGGPRNDS